MTREAESPGPLRISKMDRLIVVDIRDEGRTLNRRECEVRWLEYPEATWKPEAALRLDLLAV
jgi:hypothetical protein